MEVYIADVEETLSELTGEHGLGAKIASDVADCLKLDLLEELKGCSDINDVARVVGVMDRNAWNDVRIASAGIAELRSIQIRGGLPFAVHLLDSDGLQLLLQNMRQHAFHADLQKTAAEILQGVLESMPHQFDSIHIETANCLVNILKNHATDEFEPQRAALAALEAASSPARNRFEVPAITAVIAPAGGIPILFDALDKFCTALISGNDRNEEDIENEDNQDRDDNITRTQDNAQMVRLIVNIMESVLRVNQESSRLFVDFAHNRQNWGVNLNHVLHMGFPAGTEDARKGLRRAGFDFLSAFVMAA